MELRVMFFASIREAAGIDTEIVAIPGNEITIHDLRSFLARRNARMSEALSRDRIVKTAVDKEMQLDGFVVRDGAEVAFFPPVTGG